MAELMILLMAMKMTRKTMTRREARMRRSEVTGTGKLTQPMTVHTNNNNENAYSKNLRR
jgi:hypothetical protein